MQYLRVTNMAGSDLSILAVADRRRDGTDITSPRRTAMHYALLIYSTPGSTDPGPTPGDGVIDDWLTYTREIKDAGVLVACEQLQATDTATTVRLRDGERLLTDGPFVETKEHLLGFYLVDVADLDTALEWAARMPLIRFGTVEVRPVFRDVAWRAVLD
jgi:hypothetical protein